MGARYLTDLALVLQGAGLDVRPVDGWESRARGSGGFDGGRPWSVMWHHTASNTTPANDVAYICTGNPDAPVANLYLDRDGVVWVCAAGATNTNGKGGPVPTSHGTVPLDQMNTHAISIEMANTGTGQTWPAVQIDAAFRVTLALLDNYDMTPDDVFTHYGWCEPSCKGRKIDPATAAAVAGDWHPTSCSTSGTWSQDDIRSELWRRMTPPDPTPPTPPTPTEDDDMPITFVAAAPGAATVLVAMDGAGIAVLGFATEDDRATICGAAGDPPIVHISAGQMSEIMARAAAGDTS